MVAMRMRWRSWCLRSEASSSTGATHGKGMAIMDLPPGEQAR